MALQQNRSARARLHEWAASSHWATATIAGSAAVVAAVIKQFVAALGSVGWSWLGLTQDLITNVFLAAIVTFLVENIRRLSTFRATEDFVLQTQPMIRDAVLAWTSSGADDEPWDSDDSAKERLQLANWTLTEASTGLTVAAELGAPPSPSERTRTRRDDSGPVEASVASMRDHSTGPSDHPKPAQLQGALMHVELYVDHGGRSRRAVYARALIGELGRARTSGAPPLADASTDFVRDAERWLGMIERFNSAFAAWLATIGAAHPELTFARAVGQDPMVVACRWLRDQPDESALASAVRESATGDMLTALRDEIHVAQICVDDLQTLLVAASPRGEGNPGAS
jgi:hypothetical protein